MRVQQILFTEDCLLLLLEGKLTSFRPLRELPKDIRIVDIQRMKTLTQIYNAFSIVVESDSFPDIKKGEPISYLPFDLHKIVEDSL